MAKLKTPRTFYEILIIDYRWTFVIFLLPISFLFNLFAWIRNQIVFRLNGGKLIHKIKVQLIQNKVRIVL